MHAPNGRLRAEHIEIVESATRLAEIGPAWDELWGRAGGLVFQSHGWIAAWWQTVPDPDRRQLRVGLVWNGDRLDAVMALCVHKRRGMRFLEWAANSYSDYEDVLAAPDCPPSALERLWSQLTALHGFDIALLNRLPPDAYARRLLGSAAETKLVPNHRAEVSHRVTGDWTTGAAWFDSQSKKARQNYRRGQKAMAEAGSVRFRLLDADEPLGPVLERLSTLKRKWLAARGHTSTLFDEGAAALGALVDVLARAGVLHIFVLELDGLVVAVSVNFVQRGTMMAFVTTYDPEFERASPGTLLMTDYIMWSFDHSLHTVDFLCGAEAFKLRFATEAVTLTTLAGQGSGHGRAALAVDHLRHTLARWGKRIRGKIADASPAG